MVGRKGIKEDRTETIKGTNYNSEGKKNGDAGDMIAETEEVKRMMVVEERRGEGRGGGQVGGREGWQLHSLIKP